ncbi:MAG: M42 family metallopeptidase [Anaerolineae bacterium]|nr:M42 family metallopeptidase [Anaerolineae bacterium]
MMIKELSEAIGVSGQEDAVREVILKAIKDHVKDIRIDPLGNVLAVKPGDGTRPEAPRVMVAAHMDEVGFMVLGIDANGAIRVGAVGGFDPRILPGLRVVIGQDRVPAVFNWKPIHMGYDRTTVTLDNLRLDIGATSKEQANGKVNVGDRAAFVTAYREHGRIAVGKAFDDRVGCAVLIELIQGEPLPFDVHVAFTVQEEVGLRGAQVAAQAIKPDVAFVLEGTTAHDLPPVEEDPEAPRTSPVTELGKGPALTLADNSVIVDRRLLNHLRETAEVEGIPYQYKQAAIGGTDAGAIMVANAGVPSAVISVPCRYIHSPAAICNLDDVANAARLLRAALARFTPAVLARAGEME